MSEHVLRTDVVTSDPESEIDLPDSMIRKKTRKKPEKNHFFVIKYPELAPFPLRVFENYDKLPLVYGSIEHFVTRIVSKKSMIPKIEKKKQKKKQKKTTCPQKI